jgi:hypothetical protein
MRGYAASMFVAAMLPRCEALVYARLCRLDVRRGFASPYQLLKRDMGYAHRSGYAPGWAGGRTRGTAPIHSQKLTARHSLASHRGGEAATNEKSLHAILLHTSRRRGRKKREVVARDSASHIEAARPQETRSRCTRFCFTHRGGAAATNEKSLHAILPHTSRRRGRNKREAAARDCVSHSRRPSAQSSNATYFCQSAMRFLCTTAKRAKILALE